MVFLTVAKSKCKGLPTPEGNEKIICLTKYVGLRSRDQIKSMT